ncbi:glucosyltransferase [Conoideocrella luteorostrata]|uniref:Dol-P-Glc:Glc(2)Man(9)GlcNAc(2)-PP-Dol alpha-1,2-glucosyltransferase n=1 Tax=Conoideocrella luteorostrata TaxID=1105319 RepID=A0AAJ0CTZ1_9HYPO|nr:glucosyltransferase [Conoideocrella luteorostrata]
MANETQLERFGAASLATLVLSVPLVLLLSRGTKQKFSVFLPFSLLVLLSVVWLTLVSHTVSQPYLDEVFHIPQAQKYCEGKYLDWDDKITTPPGLYLFSILLQKAAGTIGKPFIFDCSASSLRVTNVLGLIILASLALLCRHEIESLLYAAHSSRRPKTISTYTIHTAFNIALFPLLFFFSGLYYTDVISTAVVVGSFLNHLKRVARDKSSILSDLVTMLLGALTLFMRQTNVFWVVVWMGGLEAVHAVKSLRPERVDQPFMITLADQLKFYAWRYSVGDIHDPPLGLAWPDDMLFTIVSLGVAALCNPVRVVRQIWPYLSVLAAFVCFVVWNGGVVLGDKSNHIATIHLAQLLYIWPFFAFFSLPLLTPYAISFLSMVVPLLRSKNPHHGTSSRSPTSPAESSQSLKQTRGSKAKKSNNSSAASPSSSNNRSSSQLSPGLQAASMIFGSKIILWSLYQLTTLAASATVVEYNTIIHPFTLADNRHYMFYIFRHTIRRGNAVRFMLIIPYTLTRWMIWGIFAGCSEWIASPRNNALCPSRHSLLNEGPYTSHPFWIALGSRKRQTDAAYPKDLNQVAGPLAENDQGLQDLGKHDPLVISAEPVSTSTGLIFLLATALSLMTAPLVEPRYFIIPWVMWRLLIPAWRLHDHRVVNGLFDGVNPNSLVGRMVTLFRRYDLRLTLETLWFVAINVGTGYIFLMKPYVWKDENGQVLDDGRLQRFMW